MSIVMYLDTRRVATGKEISVFDHLCAASKFLVSATSTKRVFVALLWFLLKYPTSILSIKVEESAGLGLVKFLVVTLG